jgi:hypothetical protein
MTNKFKTLLKTTAAVATLMVGSQSWGATLTAENGDTLAANKIVTGSFAALRSAGTAAAIAHGITTPAGCIVYFSQISANTFTGNITLGSKNKWYLDLAAALALPASFTSTAGVSSLIITNGAGGLTLVEATQDQFELTVLETAVVNLASNGALTLPITVRADQTLTTGSQVTSISSKLTGAGNVTLNAATVAIASDLSGLTGNLTLGSGINNVTTDLSKFKGTLITGAALDISTKLNNEKLKLPINLSTDHVVTVGAGTMKKVTGTADTAGITSTGTVVIEELVLSSLNSGETFNLSPGTGATITIKKITGVADGVIIDNTGSGTLVLPKLDEFVGVIKATGAGTITVK